MNISEMGANKGTLSEKTATAALNLKQKKLTALPATRSLPKTQRENNN